MAEGVGGRELWLPSDFLVDDFPKEGKQTIKGEATAVGGPVFPCEFPFDFGSDPSSTMESVTETDSGEEEYLAGLTRQMAHSFLQDDEDDSSVSAGSKPQNPKAMATSPQSTLCGFGIWSDSGRTSPTGSSQVSSPPSTPMEQHKDDAWDMLYKAAGQVASLRLHDQVEEERTNGRGLLGSPRNTAIAVLPKDPTAGFYASPLLAQERIKFEQLNQQQLMKQEVSAAWGRQSKLGSGGGYGDWRRGRPLGLPSSAWPPLQPQQQQQHHLPGGHGMRAVFLSSPRTRKASTGTGVFLPQRTGNHTETRKKPGCSTVLLPARVVQALNLNLDDMGAHARIPGTFVLGHDALLARSNSMLTRQKRRFRPATPVPEEIRLPAEWTY